MIDFFTYLLQVNVAFVFLYIVYRIFLNGSSSLYVKRFYLLGSSLFAFILPFVRFPYNAAKSLEAVNQELGLGGFEQLSWLQVLPVNEIETSISSFDAIHFFFYTYLIISVIFFLVTFFELNKVFRSIAENEKIRLGKLNLIVDDKYVSPFSFFNYIFIKSNKNITKTPEYVHELAHVKQLHSIDRLLVELLIPLLWINPFIYLFKKSLVEVHEHLADFAVIRNGVKPADYLEYLYLRLRTGQYLKMTSNFNYSLTKKRITMISKNISMKKSIVRTILSLIIVAGVFLFYGFNNHKIAKPAIDIKNTLLSETFNSIPSILPLKKGGSYWIGSHYGMRKHPITGKTHKHVGIDIVADRGTKIIAPANGDVIEAKYLGGYGNVIKIQHANKLVTLYAHLSEYNVKKGDKVNTNDVIAYVGSTGFSTRAHLHYEVRKYIDNEPFVFLNPANYIKNIKEIPEKE